MEKEQYKDLLSGLYDALQGHAENEQAYEANDKNLNMAIDSQSQRQDEEYDKRNKLYTQLLRTYIDNYSTKEKTKRIYKLIFFIVTMFLFFGIISVCLVGIILLSITNNGQLADAGIAIADIVGIISALIILPRIIAEHLFPANEESNMLEMVKNMQDNDANIRDILFDDADKDA